MALFDRHLWRLAGRLADRIVALRSLSVLPDLDESTWSAARKLLSRLREVAPRGWNVATYYLRRELQHRLTRLQTGLGDALSRLAQRVTLREPPSQRLVYEELVATRAEFDFEFDLRAGTLTVTTESIELDGMSFGRFQIVLEMNRLVDAPYRVVAESPRPSAARHDVTHPHVSSEQLCEGDASAPLEHALRSGRFSDFFQIVQQTLNTYNSQSPYVSLDDWDESSSCSACGSRVDDDESDYCEHCESTVCSDCSSSCSHCDNYGCESCMPLCRGCRDACCENCQKRCADCEKVRCPTCLTHSLCEDCHVETPTNQSDEETTPTGSAVQPDGVGQALVSA